MWCDACEYPFDTLRSIRVYAFAFFFHYSCIPQLIFGSIWFRYGILNVEWGQFSMKKNMRSKSTLHAFNKMLLGITIWYAKYVLYIFNHHIIWNEQRPPGCLNWLNLVIEQNEEWKAEYTITIWLSQPMKNR